VAQTPFKYAGITSWIADTLMGVLLRLTKHHGLGNDFLVLVESTLVTEADRAELARAVCHRHTGIGADGLIFVLPSDPGFDTRMRIHNADGSIPEMSGNGIRCFAQAVTQAGIVNPGTVRVQTDAGLREINVGATDPNTQIATVSVDMGTYAFDAHPVIGEGGHTVDVGNPHLVIPVDSLDNVDISVTGPDRESPYLDGPTHGINVHVVKATNPQTIDMLVWERGVGVTAACGTGATAVAGVMHRLGVTASSVEVRQPGGTARVEIKGDRATLHGPTQLIATIEYPFARSTHHETSMVVN
jgi:diaminopimelate epimerase